MASSQNPYEFKPHITFPVKQNYFSFTTYKYGQSTLKQIQSINRKHARIIMFKQDQMAR